MYEDKKNVRYIYIFSLFISIGSLSQYEITVSYHTGLRLTSNNIILVKMHLLD